MTVSLFSPLSFVHGPALRNRMMLAPLTNKQSNADGTLSDDEYQWLLYRAQGGFGLTMTCAAYVQHSGKAFAGQLGIDDDQQLPGLARLAQAVNATGSLSAVQLHHGGLRADSAVTGEALQAPWDDAKTGARALSTGEVQQSIEDFIKARLRAERAGFHGVELHGAHGYLLCQFLDAERNVRADQYGGSFENRCRALVEVVEGLRARAGKDFQIGVRLSAERFGIKLAEARLLAQQLMLSGNIDYIDMSLWDVFKAPVEPEHAHKPLIAHFSELQRGTTCLGVAGKIMSAADANAALAQGVDFVLLGRAAILHHDLPQRAQTIADFTSVACPVTREYLRGQRLGPAFIDYLKSFKDFVAD